MFVYEYNGRVVKGPLRALVNGWIVHKGVYYNPVVNVSRANLHSTIF